MRRLTLFAGALALLLAGCAARTDVEVGEAVVVELDAFSGRPNPTWILSADEVAELRRRLRGLPQAAASRLPDVGLGYRGFLLRTATPGGGMGGRIYVSHGLVQAGEPGTRPLYRDVHDIEGWLRVQARARGYDVWGDQSRS